MQRSKSTILLAALVALGIAPRAFGLAPSPDVVTGQHFVYLSTPNMDYEVSDYGWSDSWLVPATGTYSAATDVLSGDDAANLHYSIGGVAKGGNGWLTTLLDNGTLNPTHATGSTWAVTTPTADASQNTSSATSVIQQTSDGVQVTITTTVSGSTLRQTYDVKNIGNNTLTNLVFADYLNFHPNGSQTHTAANDSIVQQTVTGAMYFTSGSPAVSFVSNGYVQGDSFPAEWDIGTQSDVVAAVEAGTGYNDAAGPLGPNDVAAAIGYNVASLAPGQDAIFAINKGLGTPPVPEPASLCLLASGISIALLARSKRIR